jgi:hypothetical protein
MPANVHRHNEILLKHYRKLFIPFKIEVKLKMNHELLNRHRARLGRTEPRPDACSPLTNSQLSVPNCRPQNVHISHNSNHIKPHQPGEGLKTFSRGASVPASRAGRRLHCDYQPSTINFHPPISPRHSTLDLRPSTLYFSCHVDR